MKQFKPPNHFLIFCTLIVSALFFQKSLNAQKLSVGSQHGMIICENGTITGSGNNAYGQMGTNDFIPNNGLQVLFEGTWTEVSCGGAHTLIIHTDGTLWATGQGGKLGVEDYDNRETPIQIGSDNDWKFIEASSYTSFGIKNNGTLWAWGAGLNGQLGLDEVAESLAPAQIGAADTWLKISASQDFTLGLQNDSSIWGWGTNTQGELGDGTSIGKLSPGKTTDTIRFIDIAAGGSSFSLAISDEGYLYGTGLNNFGQLGLGNDLYSVTEWSLIDDENKYKQVAAGHSHTLLLREDNTLWATGRNDNGQLGVNSTDNSFSVVQVSADTDWKSIDANNYHSIAMKQDGSIYIWGKNKDWLMPNCDSDGLYQCNSPILVSSPCNATSANAKNIKQDQFFPNPVKSFIYFKNNACFDKLQVFDNTGRVVLRSEDVCGKIDLSDLDRGVYYIEAKKVNTYYHFKAIKQ